MTVQESARDFIWLPDARAIPSDFFSFEIWRDSLGNTLTLKFNTSTEWKLCDPYSQAVQDHLYHCGYTGPNNWKECEL